MFFTRLFFVTSNRYKFQIKDKRSLLILNVQNIAFNVVKNYVFEIFLNVLNRAYRILNSSSSLASFLRPNFLGIFLHCLYILVESLALFIANITEMFQKSIQQAVEKMHFDTHILISRIQKFPSMLFTIFIVVASSIVPRNFLATSTNNHHAANPTSFIESQNFWSLINCRIWGPSHIAAFNFLLLRLGKLLQI